MDKVTLSSPSSHRHWFRCVPQRKSLYSVSWLKNYLQERLDPRVGAFALVFFRGEMDVTQTTLEAIYTATAWTALGIGLGDHVLLIGLASIHRRDPRTRSFGF